MMSKKPKTPIWKPSAQTRMAVQDFVAMHGGPGEAFAAAKELAERIRKTAPSSIAAIKRTAHAAWNVPPSQADALEEAAFQKLFGAEQSARMHTFLKEQASSKE